MEPDDTSKELIKEFFDTKGPPFRRLFICNEGHVRMEMAQAPMDEARPGYCTRFSDKRLMGICGKLLRPYWPDPDVIGRSGSAG